MFVTLEQVQKGIGQYVDVEIGQKATGVKKFGIYFLIPTIKKTAVKYINKAKEFLPDMFNENGDIDIDALYNNAKFAIQKSGQFEFMDIIFNETDIDKLYTSIKQQ